ncbi:SDR family oxidoreductase [Myxococcota bacterium]|nr:SDR family oxidoreductase [Myxococcota bacterium]MBU1430254.1 SDR family oxidoreductase [Myxococcota bacterium]MBU1898803.1 SDR family oxidoreductase [Myxococcota bacterium]
MPEGVGGFEGQVILITGASKGIGAHLVERFRARGAWVAGCARSMTPSEDEGGSSHAVDVTDEVATRAWIREVYQRKGRLDVLINNAGAAQMNHCLLTPRATLHAALDLNYVAAAVASREAAKLMRKARYGRIINLTTIAVPMLIEGEMAYAASKAALEVSTRVMARELAPFGVTCNLVGPCPVDTDLIRGVPRPKMEALIERLPLKRMASLEDVGYAVEVFARPEAAHLSGQVLYLGGVS